MKKFFYFIASAIVALGAVACQNDFEENINTNSEGLSFYAEVEGLSRAFVGDKDEKGYPVIWENDDKLEVEDINNSNSYYFTFDGEKFTCNEEGVESIIGSEVSVRYYSSLVTGLDSTLGKEGLWLSSSVFTFSPDTTVKLEVSGSFLRFSSEYSVTLSLESEEAFNDAFLYDDVPHTSIELEAGDDVWVPFQVSAGTSSCTYTLSAAIDGEVVKSTEITLTRGKIYNLGTITKPAKAYLVPGVWEADSAWFAAYFFNAPEVAPEEGTAAPIFRTSAEESGKWVKMSDENGDGTYECPVPDGYDSVIFCRMDSAATEEIFTTSENVWEDAVWNQTADLEIDTKSENYEENNHYYVTNYGEGNSNGNWGANRNETTTPDAESAWAVSGTFNEWGDIIMTTTSTPDLFVAKGITFDAAKDKFKVKAAGNWDISYGRGIQYLNANSYMNVYLGSSEDISVAAAGTYDIYFDRIFSLVYLIEQNGDYNDATFQGEDGVIEGEEVEPIVWALTGSFNTWGADFDDYILDVTEVENLYAAYNVELTYGTEIKIKDSTTWDTSYGGGITNLNANSWMKAYFNGSNVVIAATGTYDIYFEYVKSGDSKLYLIEAEGDYTAATEQTENGVLIPDTTEEVTPDQPSAWSLSGTFNSWGDTVMVTTTTNNIFVAKSVELDAYAALKVRKDKAWTENYGGGIVYMNPNGYIQVYSSGSDISITAAGTYDIYFDYTNKFLYVVDAGADYTTVAKQTVEGKEPENEDVEVTENMLYLKPNSNWTQANARFAAYFFVDDSTNTWVSMVDSDSDGIYEVNIPEGYDYGCNVIFCRMNPNTTANNWNNKWNQTADLKAPTDGKNLYTVKDGTWDKGGGAWSVK